MDDLSRRIANLSPAKRALLELRLKKAETDLATSQAITPQVDRQVEKITARVSFAQQRLWFLNQLEPESASYNVPRAIRMMGTLNLQALEQSLNEIIRRHEPLRTHFSFVDDTLMQIIARGSAITLPVTDLSNLPFEERETRARTLAATEAARSFDLAKGPVIRASLIRLAADEHLLLLTTHHIVSDAWSAGVLFRELGELYKAFSTGTPSTLSPLSIQYADFAEWQRDWLQGDVLEEQLSYWRNQLADAAILDLPTDRPRRQEQSAHGARETASLSRPVTQQLVELSRHEGATLFMTLLAAFKTLLWRYSGQDDIVVGTPIAGRNRVEIEELIGFFINTLALRTDLSGNPTFRELLGRLKETAIGAYAHQDLPFEKLVEELQPERDLGRNPLFQVMFQFHNAPQSKLELRGLTLSTEASESETAKFDLFLVAYESDDALHFVLEYSTELFDKQTIELMLQRFKILLVGIVSNPDERLANLDFITEDERQQLLVKWNQTAEQFQSNECIHQTFESQAEQTPDAMAVICGEERLTYRKLNTRANKLAHRLQRLGVGPESLAAIRVERSPDMIVGLLGILKAGGAYVPLDASYPAERVSFILNDSQATVLLTQSHLLGSLSSFRGQVVCIDSDWKIVENESGANPDSSVTAENAAHVIYTSGSTGKPKGVVGLHRASINRFQWMWRAYPFSPPEVCCQKTSLSFVDSIWEIFGPLLQGVPLVILPDEVVKDPRGLLDSLAANNVTRIVLVPSLLRAMLEHIVEGDARLSKLKYCVCSGETLPVDLAQAFREKLPHCLLINLYGSSEVAADVTCYEVRDTGDLSSIPIGRPIANTEVYVLDTQLYPLPVGIPGELHVGGEGLARGYLGRPELSLEKFIANPFSSQFGSRLYKTGDIARFLPDGNLEYRGRRDHQVKIRGFRVELGEIEAALSGHPGIRESIVMLRDHSGDKRLVAYVVPEGQLADKSELRAYLRDKLPDYMVPSVFIMLDQFPLTASGKVNRLALPAPDPDLIYQKEVYVAPRTPAEEIIAGIWADVLGMEQVGVNEDFFALGGHSLLLTIVMARIAEGLGVDVPLRVLFEAPTVSELAERIESMREGSDTLIDQPIVPVKREGKLPLSFAQERLWFFDQIEPGSAAYNIPRAIRLRGKLDADALQKSINKVVARHEILRTTFFSSNGSPAQLVGAAPPIRISTVDLRDLPLAEREERARLLTSEESGQPFDLASGPLLRLMLLQLDNEEHIVVLTMHHIVSDAWSIAVLFEELIATYNGLRKGTESELPQLSVQYSDYAHWQRTIADEKLNKQLDYWRKQLAYAPALISLPTDRPRQEVQKFQGARKSLTIPRDLADRLKKLARNERVTLFMTLLAAFQSLLSWYSKDEDIVVGSPSAGRSQAATEPLIGYFVNTLALRTDLSGDPEFRGVLQRVREVTLGALANQDVPFEKLVDDLRPERTLSYNPLFQVWFVLQPAQQEKLDFEGLTVETLAIDSQSTRHDLQLSLWETASGINGAFIYRTDLFDERTISHMINQFENLLATVAERPTIRLSELHGVLDEADRKYRNLEAEKLEQAGHDKLRTVRRKVVTEIN